MNENAKVKVVIGDDEREMNVLEAAECFHTVRKEHRRKEFKRKFKDCAKEFGTGLLIGGVTAIFTVVTSAGTVWLCKKINPKKEA